MNNEILEVVSDVTFSIGGVLLLFLMIFLMAYYTGSIPKPDGDVMVYARTAAGITAMIIIGIAGAILEVVSIISNVLCPKEVIE